MNDAVTLITGASSGIGRELARLAAADSGTLVLTARREQRLREVAQELREGTDGVEVVVLLADLTREGDRAGLLEELERRGLAVDHFVNNAGFGDVGGFNRLPAQRQRQVVELNVAAAHDLLLRLLPGMVERGYGRVLNVASTAGLQPVPGMATYAASKSFLLHLSQALWSELKGTGVTVTCLAPGKTETEFFEVNRGFEGSLFQRLPGDDPRKVARAGYRAMVAGRRLVVPGWSNKINRWGSKLLPVGWVVTVARALFVRKGA
jgi:short-subunit dehydrogenase